MNQHVSDARTSLSKKEIAWFKDVAAGVARTDGETGVGLLNEYPLQDQWKILASPQSC